jgi:hypothetical protein
MEQTAHEDGARVADGDLREVRGARMAGRMTREEVLESVGFEDRISRSTRRRPISDHDFEPGWLGSEDRCHHLTRRGDLVAACGEFKDDHFQWPCGRRVAHGPHGKCPGVKAHPNTMIGRSG